MLDADANQITPSFDAIDDELPASATPEDELIRLAASLETDGGMPGDTDEERLRATVAALTVFLLEGHTMTRGAFSPHVTRLVAFLTKYEFTQLKPKHAGIVTRVIQAARSGIVPVGQSETFTLGWESGRDPGPELWNRLYTLFGS